METSTITITKLVPSEGMWLTQAYLEADLDRIFSDTIYLGKVDSPDNWIEWTTEQKEEYETTRTPSED